MEIDAMEALFGKSGPSDSEKAIQKDRMDAANRANAEADQRAGIAARVGSLRRSLAFRDGKKGTLGG